MTSSPLASPTIWAAINPRRMAGTAGTPAFKHRPVTTPVKASVEPTERSNPPEISRIAIPIVIVPSIERAIKMASMLAMLRNTGETMLMSRPAPSSTITRADFALADEA